LLHSQRKLDEAESLYREALESYRGSLPSGHRDIAIILDNFGVLLMAQNKLAEAELIFHEALDIKRDALPSGHPEIAVGLGKLVANLRAQNKLAEAAQLQKEALEWSRDQQSEGTSEWAQQLASLSTTLLSLSDWEQAEPLLRESLTIREKNQPDAWSTFNTQTMLGHALLGQRKFAEAEPLLLSGYTGMQERQASIPPMARDRITNALQRLVQLYTDWHAAEPDRGYEVKADQWQQELNKFNAALADQVPETDNAK
jgi:hypothetical protein